MTKKIATMGETKRLIAQNRFKIKKSLGQNFIVEPQIIQQILQAAAIDKEDIVVEIGPGMGSLTQGLAEAAGQVLAIELDQTLIPILNSTFAGQDQVTIVHGDALKLDYTALLAPLRAKGSYRPGFVVVANLPYYITTPITMNFLEGGYPWRRLVLMVQKEVAARMQAPAGGKEYGTLSLGVQYRATAKVAFTVPPQVFVPQPAVDSAVIVLEKLLQPAVEVADEAVFFRLIRAGFWQRRKNLLNSLSSGLSLDKTIIKAALDKAEIDSGRRGETLTLTDYKVLSDLLAPTLSAEI